MRPARSADLDAINGVVERAIMTWNLPERVKRLALPSYRYGAQDLTHQQIIVAEMTGHAIVGIAAMEPAATHDTPPGHRALLLHGIYVDPKHHLRGIGARLLAAVASTAQTQHYDSVLVKAHANAEAFFAARGLLRLPITNPARECQARYWLDLASNCPLLAQTPL